METDAPVSYVASSSVRSAVLRAAVERPRPTQAVVDAVTASESAVYQAVNDLSEAGYLERGQDGWAPTGTGVLVSDFLDCRRGTEAVLTADSDYWQTHDASVLPASARRTVGALSGCETVRADDADPHRVVREVARRIRAADAIDVVAPVYQQQYADAIRSPDVSARLVVDVDVVDAVASDPESEADALTETEVRVGEADFALGVTDESVLLSLPRVDGAYDSRAEVVATGDRAVRWGRRLFERTWTEARTPAAVVEESPTG